MSLDAGFAFLRQLKKHNDRDWFREHKDQYKGLVEEPAKALVLAVAAGCQAQGLPLHAKEKSPVMRVYRDIRFSKNKTPFKTHVGAELRRSFSDSETILYLHLDPAGPFVAAGIWQPERQLLHAWRETMTKYPDRFARVEAGLKAHQLLLSEEYRLTRSPRGFEQYADEPFAPALRLTSFITTQKFTVKEVAASSFVQAAVAFALAAKPLLEFAWLVEETNTHLKRKTMREEEFI